MLRIAISIGFVTEPKEPTLIDQIPEELQDRFPEIAESLSKGLIEHVPQKVLDQLPASVVQQIPAELLVDPVNITFVLAGLGVVVVSLVMFGWALAKAFARIAMFFIVLAAVGAAFLYVQI